MPYKIKKSKSGKYKVTSPHGTRAKGTSKQKAEAQVRLLQAIEHNSEFKKRVEGKHHSAPNGEFLDKKAKEFGVSI